MNQGQSVFAQIVTFLSHNEFRRCVQRYDGDRSIRRFSCWDQFLAMAFAQLTYRESLRDIEVCLTAHDKKLYHSGFRGSVKRSTLADANEKRDWRIYADFAQTLIQIARPLYADTDLGLDIDATVYALETTIDLCLSLFPWARFRRAKGAVKLHTMIDLQGSIPVFIDITDGKVHDVNVLDILIPEPGSYIVMDRGYLDFGRLYQLHQSLSFFVIRAKRNLKFQRRYSHSVDNHWGKKRSGHYVNRSQEFRSLPRSSATDQLLLGRVGQTARLPDQRFLRAFGNRRSHLSLPVASGTLLQMDQTTPAHQAVLWHIGEQREDPDLDRRLRLRPGRDYQKAVRLGTKSLHNSTSFEPDAFRKNPHFMHVCSGRGTHRNK